MGAEPTRTSRVARATFRVVAVVEALTWAGLLAGMAVKYLGSGNEAGVHAMGPLHGAAFVAYCLVTLWTARVFRWSWMLVLAGLAASVPPFGTWLFEWWARHGGHLDITGPQPGPADAPRSPRHGAASSPPR